MSLELWYWIILGILCISPFVVGIYAFKKTNTLGRSFLLSCLIGAVMTGAASLWWLEVNEDSFTIRLGVVFYVIAFVNVCVLVLFALLSMRKPPQEGAIE